MPERDERADALASLTAALDGLTAEQIGQLTALARHLRRTPSAPPSLTPRETIETIGGAPIRWKG